MDGTAFSPDEIYLTVGAFSEVAPWRSDYTRERIYYQSIRGPREDFLTIRDYLWRWDTDWFWCSRPFGVQNPVIRRVWPRRYRRSDVYRKLVALRPQARPVRALMNARRGRPPREYVIQDVEIPVERGAEFLRFFTDRVGMSPVWLCPLRLRGDQGWPLYPLQPGPGLRELRLLGHGPAAPRRGRRLLQPAGRGRGSRARRPARDCTRRRSTPRMSSQSATTASNTPSSSGSTTAAAGCLACTRSAFAPKLTKSGDRRGGEQDMALAQVFESFAGPDAPVEFLAYDGSKAGAGGLRQ